MADAAIITIRLTPEELAVLYEHATAPSVEIPYLDLLPQYSDAQRDLAMGVARRGLVARQLIEHDGYGGFIVHSLALAVVCGSLLAERSVVILTQTHMEEIGSIEFHEYAKEVYLAHTVLPDALHEFGIFADETAFRQAILNALKLDVPVELTCPAGEITVELFNRAVTLAQRGNSEAIVTALSESPMSAETVQQLATTLGGPFEFKTVCLLGDQAPTSSQGVVLAFLQNGNGLWLMESSQTKDKDQLTVQPLAASAALEKVRAYINRENFAR